MKLTRKNTISMVCFLLLWLLIGSLAWELLERLLSSGGIVMFSSTLKLGFDLSVISFYFKINPGSFFGLLFGVLLFKIL